jgi:PKD repeat protein
MKKRYKFLSGFALLAGTMIAQQAQQIIPCYTDEATRYYMQAYPEEVKKAQKEMNEAKLTPEYAARLAHENNSVSSTYALDTIPVVFHILHQGGPENIPNSTVYQALAEVNRVHTMTVPDTGNIDPYMKPVMGANNYVFQLATKDPNGNCTNGIIRHYDANTNWDQTQISNFAYTWPTNKYLNVYIVKNICSGQPCPASSGGGIIVGYTYIGGTLGMNSVRDAVVYNCSFMTGTNARSMAHEFGHWLSLPHTFGATNTPGTCLSGGNSDDFLSSAAPSVACTGVTDDTPKYAGAFSTCPPGTPNSCDVSNHANVQNIMDYSSCPLNFTNGQIKRMHNLMGSTASGRNNVVSATNKIATGVRHPQICAPTAYFHASTRVVCPNTIVTFSDSSENAHPTSWHWSFPGGTLSGTSTVNDSMPKVTYATPGTYNVSYTATTVGGSGTITASNYITVVTNVASHAGNWTEGFESATLPGSDWNVFNTAGSDWTITSVAAATGVKSAWIDNSGNTSGDISTLQSTSFDISTFNSPKLSLKLAYRQNTSSDVDKFQVYASNDCGASWVLKLTRQGTAMATVTPPSTAPFVPSSSNFTTYTVNLSAYVGSPNLRFRFVFSADPTSTGGVGNNIYLDDINLYDSAPSGIQSFEEQLGLNIYPNPSAGKVNLDFSLAEAGMVGIQVTDVLGRTIETIPAKSYGAGDHSLAVAEKKMYEPGVYIVNIEVDGKKITRKITIQ